MGRFSEALDRSAETIKRPPALPAGQYEFRVSKMPDQPRSQDTKDGPMEVLEIPVEVVKAVDVDEDTLRDFGEVARQPLRVQFLFMNDDEQRFEQTMYRTKKFFEHCGIDVEAGTLGGWIRQLPNTRFLGTVKHRFDKDDNTIAYAEIKQTAPLE